MGKTSIQWTDHSINPIRARLGTAVGHYCEKIGPGCKHCYASDLQRRFGMPPFAEQRSANVKHFLDASKLEEVLRRRTPTAYFWCDMTDMFGDWVPNEWIAACFGVMAATPQHRHMVLTKRAERAARWFQWVATHYAGREAFMCLAHAQRVSDDKRLRETEPIVSRTWPLSNVRLGVSAENQERADERIPWLLSCPAAIWFVSAEPLLGPLDLRRYMWPTHWHWDGRYRTPEEALAAGALAERRPQALVSTYARFVGWVIAGGESGPKARPLDLAWVRALRDQCAEAAATPFFMKQVGAVAVDSSIADADGTPGLLVGLKDKKGGDPEEWPNDIRVRQYPKVQP